MAVRYPIAVDNEYTIWDAFANRATGQHCASSMRPGGSGCHWFGEGDCERSETVIQQLLAAAGAGDAVDDTLVAMERPLGPEVEADWVNLRSAETYLGYGRARNFASPDGMSPGVRAHTSPPTHCRSIIGRSPAIGRPTRRAWSCIIPRVGSRSGSTRAMSIS